MARKKNALEIDAAAKLMGVTRTVAVSRLAALGYTVTCSRCGGGGRYSWNQTDGDRCFGCSGRGKMLAPITAENVAEALARIEAGDLAEYFARNAASKAINGKAAKFSAAYSASIVSKAYSALSASRTVPADVVVASPEFRAMGLLNAAHEAMSRIKHARMAPMDPIEACARIDALIAFVAEVDAAWAAFTASR